MNGSVYVNGQQVGELAGWQVLGNAEFRQDVGKWLKSGDNVVSVVVHRYRNHGRFPLSVPV